MSSCSSAPVQVIRFGVFEIDVRSGELRRSGVRIKLHEQPYRVLMILLERPGELVSREEIRQTLWPSDTFVDFDHGLNNAVNRLREALGDSADFPKFIETLPRRGYRFVGTVTGRGTQEAPRQEEPTQASPTAVAPKPTDWRWRHSLSWVAVALVLGVAAFGFRGWKRPMPDEGSSTSRVRSIVVLPLQNLSGDPAQDYFADGLTESLIAHLGNLSSLRVISRTSAMHYKGSHQPLPEIARELNVDTVIEGSVIRSGDRVRVTAQLVDAATDRHLWAQSYERSTTDIFEIENDLARAVATEVKGKLTSQDETRIAQHRPVNLDAYDAYLQARYYMERWTDEGFNKAAGYLQRAVELEPSSGLIQAQVANLNLLMAFRGMVPPGEGLSRAEAAAKKAVTLDEQSAEAHTALANILVAACDHEAARREFAKALELNPNSSEVHRFYADFLRNIGRVDDALAEKKISMALDPASSRGHSSLGMFLLLSGRNDEALSEMQQAIDMDPSLPQNHARLGLVFKQKGMYEQAEVEIRKAETMEALPSRLGSLADLYCDWDLPPNNSPNNWNHAKTFPVGQDDLTCTRAPQAKAVLNTLIAMSKVRYVPPDLVAGIYARLGEQELALSWLERATADDRPRLDRKVFDRFRSDRRFRELQTRVGSTKLCW